MLSYHPVKSGHPALRAFTMLSLKSKGKIKASNSQLVYQCMVAIGAMFEGIRWSIPKPKDRLYLVNRCDTITKALRKLPTTPEISQVIGLVDDIKARYLESIQTGRLEPEYLGDIQKQAIGVLQTSLKDTGHWQVEQGQAVTKLKSFVKELLSQTSAWTMNNVTPMSQQVMRADSVIRRWITAVPDLKSELTDVRWTLESLTSYAAQYTAVQKTSEYGQVVAELIAPATKLNKDILALRTYIRENIPGAGLQSKAGKKLIAMMRQYAKKAEDLAQQVPGYLYQSGTMYKAGIDEVVSDLTDMANDLESTPTHEVIMNIYWKALQPVADNVNHFAGGLKDVVEISNKSSDRLRGLGDSTRESITRLQTKLQKILTK